MDINVYLFSKDINILALRNKEKLPSELDNDFFDNIIISDLDKLDSFLDVFLKEYNTLFSENKKVDWMNENSTINIFSNFSYLSNEDNRIDFIRKIYYDLKHIKNDSKISFFLFSPSSDVYKVSDFGKIQSHINDINAISEDTLYKYTDLPSNLARLGISKISALESFTKSATEFFEKMLEEIKESVVTNSLNEVIMKGVTENEEVIEEAIIESINESRDEDEDLVNEMQVVQNIFEKIEEQEITKCKYNGEEIKIDLVVKELIAHVFPDHMTQINILDTVDDNYEIEFKDGTKIIRTKYNPDTDNQEDFVDILNGGEGKMIGYKIVKE